MSQHDELKRLADSAYGARFQTEGFEQTDGRGQHYGGLILHENGHTIIASCVMQPWADFIAAADPCTVLALIAENEELGRYLCTCRDCGGEGSLHTGEWHSYSPMEPPEPVMEKCGECDGTGMLGEIQDLYQVITERDELRAEVAGLRTGYQAYERVNAELKAEVEALRKDADKWKSVQRAGDQLLSDEGGAAIWSACSRVLISVASELNSGRGVVTQEGVTIGDREIGDWRVTVERIDAAMGKGGDKQ
ncbi:hypothetical protein J3Q07_16500 [Pseudomonas sp. D4-18]|uniref:hypothetical protein n=1 Tax=Pseudomonas sp. D4-18 TaxID=2817395 RepID=UPI003DA7F958